MNRAIWTVVAVVSMVAVLPMAGLAGSSSVEKADAPTSPFADWWGGKHATGDWFGARTVLDKEYGLEFSGRYYGALFGVVRSDNGNRGFWAQGINFGVTGNIGRMFDVKELEGVSLFGNFRWRDANPRTNPNDFVDASSLFQPSSWTGGRQFRVISFGIEISSAKLLPVKDMIVFRGGWMAPQAEFIDQPLSKNFMNHSIASAKGIGGNIPFSSSAVSWGGTLRVKPTDWSYIKVGVFMAYPEMTDSFNHGLAFRGYAPDTTRNDYWFMGEVGVTPKAWGLPGKYAFGAYYYGEKNYAYISGKESRGRYGFYWQADQKLYTPAGDGGSEQAGSAGSAVEERTFRQPTALGGLASASRRASGDKGLSFFSVFSAASEENNQYPFYFHAGLCYQGLLPKREEDLLMGAISYGAYSADLREMASRGHRPEATYTIALEASYRVSINKWAFVQPFVQYIVRPRGTNAVRDAAILGLYTGVNF